MGRISRHQHVGKDRAWSMAHVQDCVARSCCRIMSGSSPPWRQFACQRARPSEPHIAHVAALQTPRRNEAEAERRRRVPWSIIIRKGRSRAEGVTGGLLNKAVAEDHSTRRGILELEKVGPLVSCRKKRGCTYMYRQTPAVEDLENDSRATLRK
jgi:hypothetical protein